MKKFVTLFPNAENIHLFKDVGMIPFILQKNHDYEAAVACYKNGEYPAIESELSNLKLSYIKRLFNNNFLDSILYLFRNRKKIDILQLYHLDLKNLLILTLFKLISNKKITYLKLDANFKILNFKRTDLKILIYRLFISSVDIISVETLKIHEFLNTSNLLGKKVCYLPNGFYDFEKKLSVDYFEKCNTIITVGRVGSFVKATEILCEAFEIFSKKDLRWNLEVIGPIEKGFETYITNFFNRNPELKNRVTFTGNISSREILDSKYLKAKIFVLPSRWESFGLVYLEAMRAGCYIITSDIIPAFDVTNDGKYGEIFPVDDSTKLADILERLTLNDHRLNPDMCKLIQEFVYERFYWPEIILDLTKILESYER